MDWLTSFFDILWAVVKGYFRDGWFFFLAHAAVFYFLCHSWSRVRKAAEELENWRPQAGPPNSGEGSQPDESPELVPRASQPVSILDLYIAESEKMGAQGAFVPMTDYSDRLDSIVDGLISELQDRTNLFLIVGIAGTLFGLFEFAFLSYAELQRSSSQASGQLLNFGRFLSQSMSKAFPVGFVGLSLTFAAQLWSALPEGRLRAALASAAGRALERRKDAGISQVESLRQAVAAMQEAMQPLENLSDTLSEGLKPVADTFGYRLEELLKMTKDQFNQTQQATQNLQETIDSLQGGVNSIGAVTTQVEVLFRQLPVMLDSLAALQDRQRESIEALDKQAAERFQEVQKLDSALQETIRNFGQMPKQLAGDFKGAFAGLGAEALKTWGKYSSEYTQNLQTVYQNFLHSINSGAGDVKNGLQEAADEWRRFAQNADHLLRKPLMDLFADLRRELGENLKQLDRVVAQRYPQAARDITDFTQRLEALLVQTNELQGALADWLTGVQQAGDQIQNLNRVMAEASSRLPSTQQPGADPEMLRLLQDIGRLLREMQKQLANLENGVFEEARNGPNHRRRKFLLKILAQSGQMFRSVLRIIRQTPGRFRR